MSTKSDTEERTCTLTDDQRRQPRYWNRLRNGLKSGLTFRFRIVQAIITSNPYPPSPKQSPKNSIKNGAKNGVGSNSP